MKTLQINNQQSTDCECIYFVYLPHSLANDAFKQSRPESRNGKRNKGRESKRKRKRERKNWRVARQGFIHLFFCILIFDIEWPEWNEICIAHVPDLTSSIALSFPPLAPVVPARTLLHHAQLSLHRVFIYLLTLDFTCAVCNINKNNATCHMPMHMHMLLHVCCFLLLFMPCHATRHAFLLTWPGGACVRDWCEIGAIFASE